MTDRSPERAGGTPAEPDDSGLPLWWIVSAAAVIAVLSALAGAILALFAERGHPALAGIGPTVVAVAEMPKTLKDAVEKASNPATDLLAKAQRFEGMAAFDFAYAPGTRPDAPYYLLNRYDGDALRSVSELVDLDSQQIVHRWVFDVDPIWRATEFDSEITDVRTASQTLRFRNFHADLAPDGSLVTQGNASPLIKVGLCGETLWSEGSDLYHHSVERDAEGNYWVPGRLEPKVVDFGGARFLDHSITQISPEGDILFSKSVAEILIENDLGVLLVGQGHGYFDPIHLNDIQPVFEDGEIWRKGDVFLSPRHLSMILLYRPETNEVIWHRMGPWIHQHDVNVLDARHISVFDNAARLVGYDNWTIDTVSGMWRVDVVDNTVAPIAPAGFAALDLRTETEGRGRVLPDGTVFVEETNYGRAAVFDADGRTEWTYVNRAARDGQVYLLNWSRIVDRETGDAVRDLLEKGSCDD